MKSLEYLPQNKKRYGAKTTEEVRTDMASHLSEKDFEAIVEKTRKVVLSAISRTLDSEFYEAIDDVAQNTYFRLYKSLIKRQFRGDSKLETYVYTIARNESLRMNKRMVREKKKSRKVMDLTDEKDFITDNSDQINRLALENALDRLPSSYREVMMYVIDNMSVNEISNRLNIPKGTVKSRTKRGRDLLKKILMEA